MSDGYKRDGNQYTLDSDALIRIGRYTLIPCLTASNLMWRDGRFKTLQAVCTVDVMFNQTEHIGTICIPMLFKVDDAGNAWHHFDDRATLRENGEPVGEEAVKAFQSRFRPCNIFTAAQWTASALGDFAQSEVWKHTDAVIDRSKDVGSCL